MAPLVPPVSAEARPSMFFLAISAEEKNPFIFFRKENI
jgi:hypothetical protein